MASSDIMDHGPSWPRQAMVRQSAAGRKGGGTTFPALCRSSEGPGVESQKDSAKTGTRTSVCRANPYLARSSAE